MAKSKTKKTKGSTKPAASGMVVKSTPGTGGKPSASGTLHKNYSATKKSGMQSIPRKTQ